MTQQPLIHMWVTEHQFGSVSRWLIDTNTPYHVVAYNASADNPVEYAFMLSSNDPQRVVFEAKLKWGVEAP